MNIKVYGTGCPKCQALMANVEAALKSTTTQATTEKVTDIDKIIARGIMTTPALEIDGEIVSAGRIMSADEIAHRISPTKAKPSCGCSCGNAWGLRVRYAEQNSAELNERKDSLL